MGALIHIPETAPHSGRETICFRWGQWQNCEFDDLCQWDLAAQVSSGRLWRYHRAPCFWVQSDPFTVVSEDTCYARPFFDVPAPNGFRDHFERVTLRSAGGDRPPSAPTALYDLVSEVEDPPRYCSTCEDWTRHHDGQCRKHGDLPVTTNERSLAQASLF